MTSQFIICKWNGNIRINAKIKIFRIWFIGLYSSIGFYKNQVGGAVSRKMVYSLDSFKHLGVADEISHEKFLCLALLIQDNSELVIKALKAMIIVVWMKRYCRYDITQKYISPKWLNRKKKFNFRISFLFLFSILLFISKSRNKTNLFQRFRWEVSLSNKLFHPSQFEIQLSIKITETAFQMLWFLYSINLGLKIHREKLKSPIIIKIWCVFNIQWYNLREFFCQRKRNGKTIIHKADLFGRWWLSAFVPWQKKNLLPCFLDDDCINKTQIRISVWIIKFLNLTLKMLFLICHIKWRHFLWI